MLLKDVWIDAPHRHRRLILFRLMDPEGRTLPYRLMSEALEAGTLRIEEVDERGSVPELMAHNAGERDGLVLDGQHLVGAKQNRMTNRRRRPQPARGPQVRRRRGEPAVGTRFAVRPSGTRSSCPNFPDLRYRTSLQPFS